MDPEEVTQSLYQCTDKERAAILKDAGLTETRLSEAVDALIDWFEKQPHLVAAGLNRHLAELFVLISKGSIERCKERINDVYRWRYYAPEFIQNREHILDNMDTIWNSSFLTPFPQLFENKRIMFMKFGPDIDNFDLVKHYQMICLFLDLRVQYDFMMGDVWILDVEHMKWALILAQNPMVLRKINQLFTKSKSRISSVHVINAKGSASTLQRMLDFFKQFVSNVIMNRLLIHESLEDLYKHIPKEFLPQDYGGKLQSLEEFKETWRNELKKPHVRNYLIECSKMISDEKLRPGDEKDTEDLLSGSFRKLEVD